MTCLETESFVSEMELKLGDSSCPAVNEDSSLNPKVHDYVRLDRGSI